MLRCRRCVLALVSLAVTLGAGRPPACAADDAASLADHAASIDAWHARRIERLKSPTGYLSLVGLFPLETGEREFGSDPSNDLVFPGKAPARAGTLVVSPEGVTLEAAADVVITFEGARVTSLLLRSDSDGDPTALAMGTFRFYVIDREGKLFLRLQDSESDLLQTFAGIERFPVDAGFRIVARFERYDPPRPIHVPNVIGFDFEEACPGVLVIPMAGGVFRLEPMSEDEDGFFVVFGDATNGEETYGGGRFLVVDPPDAEGRVVVDFNRAYNPPCAFTPYATCPLPHEGNILPVRIEAGEKTYDDGGAHGGDARGTHGEGASGW